MKLRLRTCPSRRDRLRSRFPRLAAWLSDPGAVSAIALALWGSAIAAVAAGTLPRHALWYPALGLLGFSAFRFTVTAYHFATCPCAVRPAPWDQVPQDEADGGGR